MKSLLTRVVLKEFHFVRGDDSKNVQGTVKQQKG